MSSKKKRRKEVWLLRENKKEIEREREEQISEAIDNGTIEKAALVMGIKLR